MHDSEELNDKAAGYFNGCVGIGEAIGPISASFLISTLGFRSSCDLLALTVLVYTLFFFLFNGRSDIFACVNEDDEYAAVVVENSSPSMVSNSR